MTDDELRTLVREAIARHLGSGASPAAATTQAAVPVPLWRSHPSFGKYLLPTGQDSPRQSSGGAEAEGSCLIEPTVQCNHCGFCVSHGH